MTALLNFYKIHFAWILFHYWDIFGTKRVKISTFSVFWYFFSEVIPPSLNNLYTKVDFVPFICFSYRWLRKWNSFFSQKNGICDKIVIFFVLTRKNRFLVFIKCFLYSIFMFDHKCLVWNHSVRPVGGVVSGCLRSFSRIFLRFTCSRIRVLLLKYISFVTSCSFVYFAIVVIFFFCQTCWYFDSMLLKVSSAFSFFKKVLGQVKSII